MTRYRSIDQETWLEVLQSRGSRIRIDLVGTPGTFRVPRNWDSHQPGLPEHLFHLVADGSFSATVGHEVWEAGENAFLWVPPRTPFRFQAPRPGKTIIYRFRFRLMRGTVDFVLEPSIRFVGRLPGCRFWMERLLEEVHAPSRRSASRIKGLSLCFFNEVFDAAREAEEPSRRLTRAQQLLLAQHVQDHLGIDVTPGDLAALLGYSPDYFSRLFRNTFSLPARRWIVEERIRLARLRLLESDLTVSEVADEFGYLDTYFFSRQFKQFTGQSPTRYRAAFRGEDTLRAAI